jgi:hypothetical protein
MLLCRISRGELNDLHLKVLMELIGLELDEKLEGN